MLRLLLSAYAVVAAAAVYWLTDAAADAVDAAMLPLLSENCSRPAVVRQMKEAWQMGHMHTSRLFCPHASGLGLRPPWTSQGCHAVHSLGVVIGFPASIVLSHHS